MNLSDADGAAAPAHCGPEAGDGASEEETILDTYVIEREIGHGAYGTVFSALDKATRVRYVSTTGDDCLCRDHSF